MREEILIVQPDPEQRATLRGALEAHGLAVSEAASLDVAGELLNNSSPDAVLLQWSGSQAIRSFIEDTMSINGNASICAIVTAYDSELPDAITALEMGIDDCVRIPADSAELIARLNASLRRRQAGNRNRIAVGPLLLDKDIHCLCIDGKPVSLAPTEFRLMTFFLENPGRVFSREEILREAWQRNISAGSRTVDVHVRRLRQVLEPFRCEQFIQTVPGFGYRFRKEPVAQQ